MNMVLVVTPQTVSGSHWVWFTALGSPHHSILVGWIPILFDASPPYHLVALEDSSIIYICVCVCIIYILFMYIIYAYGNMTFHILVESNLTCAPAIPIDTYM